MSPPSNGSSSDSMSLPRTAEQILLNDAITRNLVTARRKVLLETIWHQSYLTRAELIQRAETELGTGCYGTRSRPDAFYRDIKIVRQALAAAGYHLGYSRRPGLQGYYLKGTAAANLQTHSMPGASAPGTIPDPSHAQATA